MDFFYMTKIYLKYNLYLKLEAEITSLQSSLTCKKRLHTARLECSLTGQVGKTMIVLLEGVAPNQQSVFEIFYLERFKYEAK